MCERIEVKKSTELGRYAIAAEFIQAGEVIFEEIPFVIGPKPYSVPVCLGCCCPVDGTNQGPRCSECKWPLCSSQCPSIRLHDKECKLFVENNVKFMNFPISNDLTVCLQLNCITPLRLLLEKEAQPERWNQEIVHMEYHNTERRKTTKWQEDQTNIVGYLRGPCKLKNRFSAELIEQACGILEINAFEGRSINGHSLRCIYPKTAIMAHSCVPNTIHSILPSDNFKINVRATVDIPKGELLYATYTYTTTGTLARQEHLKASKYFICKCSRCLDPTELGTYFSSLKCNKCESGIISSTNPIEPEITEWHCSGCTFKTTNTAIQTATQLIQDEVDELMKMSFTTIKLEKTEQLIQKYENILHPMHFIQTCLRQLLIEMYGHVAGYTLPELPDVILEHKIDLCKQILQILDIFEPGKTRSRALVLNELYKPILLTTRSKYSVGLIDKIEMERNIKEIIDILTEIISILEWEDVTSVERNISTMTKDTLEKLKLNYLE